MDPSQGHPIQAIEHARLTNSIALGVISIWAYDYIAALPLEVELIWKSNWGLVKSVFLLARIVFPIHAAFTSAYLHSLELTAKECHSYFIVSTVLGLFHSFLAEVVIYLQVYALSQRNKWMGIFLFVQYIGFAAACATLQGLFFKSMEYITLPYQGFHCVPFKLNNDYAGATYNVAIATENLLVLITLWIVWRKYREMKSAVLNALLRDGLLYMYGIVLLSIATTIIAYRAPDTLKFVLGQPKGVFIHILFTRLVLHLRSTSAKEVDYGVSSESRGTSLTAVDSSIHFASRSRYRFGDTSTRFNDTRMSETMEMETGNVHGGVVEVQGGKKGIVL
ncbi:hypothetical protein CC1G_10993 [Coprinopsis cinerea okayama7|uniref:DUF6533 domain-containing protein n=1 Tax=Coprinopsis cinerea (strain Okayama-7 / 130 / ATCC MYA-4618 / FGSC 9003) TaxID=240176 RepID=A8P719_COPC7|nr:hypothetical protein CC1G_10993 [Coprinopsis cinerea okayama7\|eukprot:XP_001839271.2 hypothetical protein CC1G_10993 [Coprinopsis cinerea okayama7\